MQSFTSISLLSRAPQWLFPLVTSAVQQPQIKCTARPWIVEFIQSGQWYTMEDLHDPEIEAGKLKGISTAQDE